MQLTGLALLAISFARLTFNPAVFLDYPRSGTAVLNWHLTSNHFPPLHDAVGFARLALKAVEEGRGDEPLDTGPDVPTPRRAPSAWAVIESWHLDCFLADDGEEIAQDAAEIVDDAT